MLLSAKTRHGRFGGHVRGRDGLRQGKKCRKERGVNQLCLNLWKRAILYPHSDCWKRLSDCLENILEVVSSDHVDWLFCWYMLHMLLSYDPISSVQNKAFLFYLIQSQNVGGMNFLLP